MHSDPTPRTFQALVEDTPPPGTPVPQAVEARSVDTATPDLPSQGRDTINDRDSPVAKRPSDPNEGGPPSPTLVFHLTKIG